MANLVLNVNPTLSFLDVATYYQIVEPRLLIGGLDAVHNHIENVLLTPRGSEWFEPTYACNLEYYLFENLTDVNGWQIRNEVLRSMRQWLPWLQASCNVRPDYLRGLYELDMPYTIPLLGLHGRYVASFGHGEPRTIEAL